MAGNTLIGSLRVALGLDSAQFESGLKKAQGSLGGMAGAASKAGVAIGAAFAAAAGVMAVAVENAIDHADELGKVAQKIGVSVEALSRLEYAAELSDVSLDQLANGLKKLGVNMDAAAGKATGPAAAAFKRLGISVTDASGELKSSDQVLTEVAGKFAPMADGASKTALAVALFGKAGSDLIPLLNSGADGLAEMSAEADLLGITIDTKTAKSAETFNDNLTRLKAAGGGVATQLASGLLPGLEALSQTFVDGAKDAEFMGEVSGALNFTFKALASAGVITAAVFQGLSRSFAAVAKAFAQAKSGDWAGAWETINKPVGAGANLKTDLDKIWAANGAGMKPAAPKRPQFAAEPAEIKARGKAEKKEVEDAGKLVRDAYDDVHDSLLTDSERRSQQFSAALLALQNAQKAGLISEQTYLDEKQRLDNKYRDALKPLAGFDLSNLTGQLDGLSDVPVLNGLDRLADDLQQAADAADEVAFGIEDIFFGLHGNNWAQAAAGITRALSAVQKAFSAAGTSADKFAAVAGVAQGLGSVIGGKAGGALSGAASGALAGAQLGSIIPGVGTAIGAVAGGILGGISSLFGSSKQKKAEKAAAAKAAADAEAARVAAETARLQEVANQKRTLEIAIMRASGNEIGAVAAERADELAATDESNRGLVAQLHNLRDAADAAAAAADAAAKAQGIADERRGLEIALMETTGDAAGALAAKRADELAALDASNRGLQQAIYAAEDYADHLDQVSQAAMAVRDAQVEALEDQAGALRGVIDKFRAFSSSLREFRTSLDQQDDAATGYGAAAAAFSTTAGLAKLGNEKALGSLQSVSEKFLAVSRDSAATQFDFLKDLGLVKRAVDEAAGTADRTADIAQGQLNGIEASVAALGALDLSVKGIQGSVNGLSLSILAQIQDAALRDTALAEAQKTAALVDDAFAKEIAALRESLEAGLAAVAANTGATARELGDWTVLGLPPTQADAA